MLTYYHSALFLQHKEVLFFVVFVCRSSFITPLNLSAMAVESVTVVAPEVRVGPFVLSKGATAMNAQPTQHHLSQCCHLTQKSLVLSVSSAGLVEMIDNYQTLSLRDFTATNVDPFLSIHDDYFYHTQTPRKPEVSSAC